jgi:hypothetical protein
MAVVLLSFAAAGLLAGCASKPAGATVPSRSAGRVTSQVAPGTTPPATATRSTRTVVRHFHPGDGPVQQGTGSRPGSCWTGSIAAPVRGAYRCLAGNDILDPCFAASTPDVRCYASPWAKALVLRLTKPLPRRPIAGHPRYWALALANGAHCVALTGTVAVVDGHPLAYSCSGGRFAGLTAGSGPALRVRYGRASGPLRTLAVTVAWRG